MDINRAFTGFAEYIAEVFGQAYASIIAFSVVIIWLITGPIFSYSDTWQLVINTGTSIVTFLMVFLIQNTQNRDGAAIQIKLDELLRTDKGAQISLLASEDLSDDQLDYLKQHYKQLADIALEKQAQRSQNNKKT